MPWWLEPTAGEIFWCYFQDNIQPKPKPLLGLIISNKLDDKGMIFVSVAYGNNQKHRSSLPWGILNHKERATDCLFQRRFKL